MFSIIPHDHLRKRNKKLRAINKICIAIIVVKFCGVCMVSGTRCPCADVEADKAKQSGGK